MASALSALAVLLQAWHASAAEMCTKPTGGAIPLVYSGCVEGTKKCFNWMNARCDDGWCLCKDDECIMDGQCVPKGSCATITGGTCALAGCDRWRNATCSEKDVGTHEAHCVCGPGTCPVSGECRVPGDCAKSTGGSCNVLKCNAWRKATCSVDTVPGPTEEARCMCGEDSCPINGECVKKGGCPRYAGSSCQVFQATGLLPCDAGECSDDGYCQCPEGQCFVHGKCQTADAETIELSRTWGLAQSALAKDDRGSSLVLVMGFSTAFMVSVAIVGVVKRMKGSSSDPAEYESLEG